MEIKDLSCFIFDMDGVVFNTEEVWKYGYMYANEHIGINLSEEYRKTLCGMNRGDIIEKIGKDFYPVDALAYRVKAEEYTFRELDNGNFNIKPHFLDLVKKLKEKNIKIALATSATRERMNLMFKKKGINKDDIFDCVICGEDAMGHSKPDPFIYIQATKRLNLKPSECCVIEDSLNGNRGAVAGGFVPIMDVDLIEPDEFCKKNCKCIVRDLGELINLLD